MEWVIIGFYCILDKDVLISADNMSEVNINDAVSIGYKSKLVALDNSLVNIKSKCKLLEQSNITSRKKSKVKFLLIYFEKDYSMLLAVKFLSRVLVTKRRQK